MTTLVPRPARASRDPATAAPDVALAAAAQKSVVVDDFADVLAVPDLIPIKASHETPRCRDDVLAVNKRYGSPAHLRVDGDAQCQGNRAGRAKTVANAEREQGVGAAEIPFFFEPPVPTLRLLTREIEGHAAAPCPDQRMGERRVHAVTVARAIGVRIFGKRHMGEGGRAKGGAPHLAADGQDKDWVPYARSQLKVFVGKSESAKREWIGPGPPDRDRNPRSAGYVPDLAGSRDVQRHCGVGEAHRHFVAVMIVRENECVRTAIDVLVADAAPDEAKGNERFHSEPGTNTPRDGEIQLRDRDRLEPRDQRGSG